MVPHRPQAGRTSLVAPGAALPLRSCTQIAICSVRLKCQAGRLVTVGPVLGAMRQMEMAHAQLSALQTAPARACPHFQRCSATHW